MLQQVYLLNAKKLLTINHKSNGFISEEIHSPLSLMCLILYFDPLTYIMVFHRPGWMD